MNTFSSTGIEVSSSKLYIMIGRHIAYFWYIEKTSAKSKLPMQYPHPVGKPRLRVKGCTCVLPSLPIDRNEIAFTPAAAEAAFAGVVASALVVAAAAADVAVAQVRLATRLRGYQLSVTKEC